MIGEMKATTTGNKVIDLRSETVTRTSPEILQAMITTQVGNDVLMDDPTVQLLESRVAELCGKEAVLFTCSGVMVNQICLKIHLEPLTQIIVDSRSHIYRNECGGIAYHSRASVMPIERIPPLNYITAEQIEAKINTNINYQSPITRAISIENTLNGMIFPMEELLKIRMIADKYHLALHLDGARLWNSHIATGIAIKDYGKVFDSMRLCFSKGMGTPIGSVIVGSKSFICKARQYRQLFGGGMRQVGILAATCLFSLEHILPKLHLDHENAKKLESGILKLVFSIVVPVDTNMVFVNSTPLGIPFKYFEEY